MSAIQFKEKNTGSKTSAYYGRLQSGLLSSRCSEMTRDEAFSLARIRAFAPGDFEAYRARGEEFRKRLSGAVLHLLKPGGIWVTDCECREEWGVSRSFTLNTS